MAEGPIHPTLACHPTVKPKCEMPIMETTIHLTLALHLASEVKYKPLMTKRAKMASVEDKENKVSRFFLAPSHQQGHQDSMVQRELLKARAGSPFW